jgi:hypothetical protein
VVLPQALPIIVPPTTGIYVSTICRIAGAGNGDPRVQRRVQHGRCPDGDCFGYFAMCFTL